MADEKKTHGDIFKLYVWPPGGKGWFPRVELTHHPYGIRKAGTQVDIFDVGIDREELAKQIGEMVIKHSPILQAWIEKYGKA